MAPLVKKLNERFTYSDYLNWPDSERFEIIDGVIYNMSPAPATEHQAVAGEIFGNIWQFLKNKKCRVFLAPFDVRFAEYPDTDNQNIYTVVQPDITVICDEKKIDNKGCIGSPDLVVEILSPATAYKDETEKLKLYEQHRVKEYWIVNPVAKYIMKYTLNEDKYAKPEYLTEDEVIESKVLTGLKIQLSEIWK